MREGTCHFSYKLSIRTLRSNIRNFDMHIIKPLCHKYEILFSAKLVGGMSRRHALLFHMHNVSQHGPCCCIKYPSLTLLLHPIEVALSSSAAALHFLFFSSVEFLLLDI